MKYSNVCRVSFGRRLSFSPEKVAIIFFLSVLCFETGSCYVCPTKDIIFIISNYHILMQERVSLWYLHICMQYTLIKFIPSIAVSSLAPSFNPVFINRFHHSIFIPVYKVLQSSSPPIIFSFHPCPCFPLQTVALLFILTHNLYRAMTWITELPGPW
jgi:hypothetical protein